MVDINSSVPSSPPSSHQLIDDYYARVREMPIERIVELLGISITERHGATLYCDCPRHASTSKRSLHVHTDRNIFYCFACGVGGGAIRFVEWVKTGEATRSRDGLTGSHRMARDFIAQQLGMPLLSSYGVSSSQIAEIEETQHEKRVVFGLLTRFIHHFHRCLLSSPEKLEWLQAHYGFSREFIIAQQIGYVDPQPWVDVDTSEKHPRMYDRIEGVISKSLGLIDPITWTDVLKTGLFISSATSSQPPVCGMNHRYVFPYWSRGQVVYAIGRQTKWAPQRAAKGMAGRVEIKYWKLLTHSEDKHPYVSKLIRNDLLHNEEALNQPAGKWDTFSSTSDGLSNNSNSNSDAFILKTEGVTDNLSAMQVDLPAVSPVTVRIKKYDWKRLLPKLKNKAVYLIGDNEISGAGEKGVDSDAQKLELHGIETRIVTLPLDDLQMQARETLKSKYGIYKGLSQQATRDIKLSLAPKDLTLCAQLIADSKMDLNLYLKAHSREELIELLRVAPTRVERVLRKYEEIIQASAQSSGNEKPDSSIDSAGTLGGKKSTKKTKNNSVSSIKSAGPGPSKTLSSLLADAKFIETLAAAEHTNPQAHYDIMQALAPSLRTEVKKQVKRLKIKVVEDGTKKTSAIGPLLNELGIKPIADTERLSLPFQYELTLNGVEILKKNEAMIINRQTVCPQICYVARKIHDIKSNEQYIEVAFRQKNAWHKIIGRRAELFDSSKVIAALAPHGFHVTSRNKNRVTDFISEFEKHNEPTLIDDATSSTLGYIPGTNKEIVGNPDNSTTYLFNAVDCMVFAPQSVESVQNDRETGKSDLTNKPNTLPQQSNSALGTTTFRPSDTGDLQYARGFHKSGDFSTWASAAAEIIQHPRVSLFFYAGLTAPFLQIFGAKNFFVDLSAESRHGKTIALRFAMSPWGCPNEDADPTITHIWNSTNVSLERLAALITDHPLALDDTKTARNIDKLGEIVYQICSGHPRSRGTIRGLSTNNTWKTVVLTTGEGPLADYVSDAGAKNRILTIAGNPFGRYSQEGRKQVLKWNSIFCTNYGHLAPMIIQQIINNQAHWEVWRKRFFDTQIDCDSDMAQYGRFVDQRAAITTAAEIIHAFGILPWEFKNPFDALFPELCASLGDTDMPRAALQHLYSWCVANRERFAGQNDSPPYKGLAGRWDKSETWNAIYILSHVMDEIFETRPNQRGYDWKAVRTAWAATGALKKGTDGKFTRSVWIYKHKARCYIIDRAAIEDMLRDGESGDESEGDDLGPFGDGEGREGETNGNGFNSDRF